MLKTSLIINLIISNSSIDAVNKDEVDGRHCPEKKNSHTSSRSQRSIRADYLTFSTKKVFYLLENRFI